MKILKLCWLLPAAALLLSCSLSNECELSERYTPGWTQFVLDRGFNLYEFRVSFEQIVEVYMGDCAADKYRNETRLKITSKAPCDQTINFIIEVTMGDDSYQVKKNDVAIRSNETIDFGIVKRGGSRIDLAGIDVAIYCPKCPGDE
ncbi:hypothetical protein EH222_03525 [candidate division KSB1 bacterium]|nr:MAG: hypothetical protein EH222_03525 [candidate division KSB1 bacterium]